MARVQALMSARGLDGTEKHIRPFLRRVTKAFRTRDFEALTAACDELVDVIEAGTAPAGEGSGTTAAKPIPKKKPKK